MFKFFLLIILVSVLAFLYSITRTNVLEGATNNRIEATAIGATLESIALRQIDAKAASDSKNTLAPMVISATVASDSENTLAELDLSPNQAIDGDKDAINLESLDLISLLDGTYFSINSTSLNIYRDNLFISNLRLKVKENNLSDVIFSYSDNTDSDEVYSSKHFKFSNQKKLEDGKTYKINYSYIGENNKPIISSFDYTYHENKGVSEADMETPMIDYSINQETKFTITKKSLNISRKNKSENINNLVVKIKDANGNEIKYLCNQNTNLEDKNKLFVLDTELIKGSEYHIHYSYNLGDDENIIFINGKDNNNHTFTFQPPDNTGGGTSGGTKVKEGMLNLSLTGINRTKNLTLWKGDDVRRSPSNTIFDQNSMSEYYIQMGLGMNNGNKVYLMNRLVLHNKSLKENPYHSLEAVGLLAPDMLFVIYRNSIKNKNGFGHEIEIISPIFGNTVISSTTSKKVKNLTYISEIEIDEKLNKKYLNDNNYNSGVIKSIKGQILSFRNNIHQLIFNLLIINLISINNEKIQYISDEILKNFYKSSFIFKNKKAEDYLLGEFLKKKEIINKFIKNKIDKILNFKEVTPPTTDLVFVGTSNNMHISTYNNQIIISIGKSFFYLFTQSTTKIFYKILVDYVLSEIEKDKLNFNILENNIDVPYILKKMEKKITEEKDKYIIGRDNIKGKYIYIYIIGIKLNKKNNLIELVLENNRKRNISFMKYYFYSEGENKGFLCDKQKLNESFKIDNSYVSFDKLVGVTLQS